MSKTNKSCVYIHIFPNGKVYIGQTKQTTAQRWIRGKGYKGQLVERAIKKYGWENIEHKVLYTDLSEEEANNLEIELIAKYKSTDERYGYNISSGGKGMGQGLKHSPEHYEMLSARNRKAVDCYNRDGEYLASFKSIMAAADCVNGGFKVISACCNGAKKSAYGYVWRFKGEPFNKYETASKKGGVKGFPVEVFDEKGKYVGRFKNVKAASKATGIREDVIAKVCKGKLASKNGLVFFYEENRRKKDE